QPQMRRSSASHRPVGCPVSCLVSWWTLTLYCRFMVVMQLSGCQCCLCKKNIMLEAEATWCAGCMSVFHKDCLAKSETICPRCGRHYDPPERHFVFSQFCPESAQTSMRLPKSSPAAAANCRGNTTIPLLL